MLRSMKGENDHTSSGSTSRPYSPAIRATQRFAGNVRNSPCRMAGIARNAPPTAAHQGPSSTPRITVASKAISAARKFGTVTRAQTPSVSGMQMQASRPIVSPAVRSSANKSLLKTRDRASALDTAAAMPSLINSEIRTRRGSYIVARLCGFQSLPDYNLRMSSITVRKIAEADFPSRWGHFRIHGFEGVVTEPEPCRPGDPSPSRRVEGCVALVLGDIHVAAPIVRIHSQCLTGDVFGSFRCDCRQQFELAMQRIVDEGAGVLIYEQQEGRGIGLMAKLRAYELQDKGLDTIEANLELGYKADCRLFEVPAKALKLLGIHAVRLITNNPEKIAALEEQGIRVVERISAEVPPASPLAERYLETKQARMGHFFTEAQAK